jgi:porin
MPAITARADDPEDWLAGEHATGDWGGLRDALKEAGITVEGSYVVDLQALTHGGASHGGNWDYAGLMDLGIDFDLEKLMGLDGLSFFIQAGWASGDDLARKVGSIFSPGEAFSGRSLRLARMYLQQDLLNEQLQLKIGRLATEDDFLSSPIYLEYVSGAINSVPGSILESTPGFTTFPFAQWGVVAAGKPTEHLRLAAGIYASDADINKDKEHGVDFSLDTNKGVMTIGEIGYSWGPDLSKSKKTESKNMTELGLPGNVKLGGWYDTGPRTSLKDDTQSKGNNGGLYVRQVFSPAGAVDAPPRGSRTAARSWHTARPEYRARRQYRLRRRRVDHCCGQRRRGYLRR